MIGAARHGRWRGGSSDPASDRLGDAPSGATVLRVPRPVGPCAMLALMDWIFVGFVGLLAIALAVAIGIALDRERSLGEIGRAHV